MTGEAVAAEGAAGLTPHSTAAEEFGPDRAAPRAARAFTQETLRNWGEDQAASDAAIIVGELAANAVRHAGTRFTVTLSRMAGMVRIAVSDGGPPPGAGLRALPGHGLAVVAVLAARWGVDSAAAGKRIWAELPATSG